MNSDDVMKAIEPKSDQLNADDLIGGPIDVTIKEVRRGNTEQPIVLVIDGGHKPYKPSKGMTRVIVRLLGKDPKGWVGHSLRLYNDPSVKWAGVAVGGIRISHMTGLDNAVELMLTVSRGKREGYRVEPLQVKDDINERINKAIVALGSADSTQVEKYWAAIKRDLLPSATKQQTQILYCALIGKQVIQNDIAVLVDEAIDAGCEKEVMDSVGNERFQELKEADNG